MRKSISNHPDMKSGQTSRKKLDEEYHHKIADTGVHLKRSAARHQNKNAKQVINKKLPSQLKSIKKLYPRLFN